VWECGQAHGPIGKYFSLSSVDLDHDDGGSIVVGEYAVERKGLFLGIMM